MSFDSFRFDGERKFHIDEFAADASPGYKGKEEAARDLLKNLRTLSALQDKLFAQNRESVLVILQAMDTAGKDGAVKHILSGLNPAGVVVTSFKQPSAEEQDHDYLWRAAKALPARGCIGIFNRSYYEETLVVRVHELYKTEKLPPQWQKPDIFERRYRQINDFERYLHENGVTVLKFFLHISKEEQKKRLLARIDREEKNWKFSAADLTERQYFGEYQCAYEDTISATSTRHAPWHVIPADKKWFARLCISHFLVQTLEHIDPRYPELSDEQKAQLGACRARLMAEDAEHQAARPEEE